MFAVWQCDIYLMQDVCRAPPDVYPLTDVLFSFPTFSFLSPSFYDYYMDKITSIKMLFTCGLGQLTKKKKITFFNIHVFYSDIWKKLKGFLFIFRPCLQLIIKKNSSSCISFCPIFQQNKYNFKGHV